MVSRTEPVWIAFYWREQRMQTVDGGNSTLKIFLSTFPLHILRDVYMADDVRFCVGDVLICYLLWMT